MAGQKEWSDTAAVGQFIDQAGLNFCRLPALVWSGVQTSATNTTSSKPEVFSVLVVFKKVKCGPAPLPKNLAKENKQHNYCTEAWFIYTD